VFFVCMSPEGGATRSLWASEHELPRRAPLGGRVRADVCVVGAGIAGLTAAHLLAREGREVVVLDDGPIGGGETGRTTAHLASEIDDGLVEIERLFGEDGARLAHESHAAAIDRIEAIVAEEAIDCAFRRVDGYLFLAEDDEPATLEEELAAARRARFAGVERRPRLAPDGVDLGPCLRFPRQAQLHALRYLDGLARALERRGGRIFTGSHASAIESRNGTAHVAVDGGGAVTAESVLIATNSPVNDRFAMHTKQAPYRTYAIAGPVSAEIEPALWWDTGDPYHYVRLEQRPGGGRTLIAGGEDHKTGHARDAEERWARLEAWTRRRFPSFGAVEHRWSGQVLETIDGLGFLGRNPADEENVYVVTGDSGMGMTHGTLGGIIVADLVLGRENPWTRLYDPRRKTLAAARDWVFENLDVAKEMTAHVTPGEVSSLDEIRPGEGALLRRGLTKIAAFRDETGAVHERSAICPHLGCVVAWNPAEKTWDCPCHGSRFEARGRVLNGPAGRDLSPAG
jgi:glycine/D-amino acid oxidase-like deaminating enzyme/nitrite reductase/ring-hydroxylating ferredoxin subunit